jgi:uncharacterized protein (TIGR02217 family)
MAHFNNVILPTRVRFGSSAAPRLNTQLLFAASGIRKANQIHAEPIRQFRLIYKRPLTDAYDILETWMALGGPFHSGLLRDWTDWHTGSDNNMKPAGSSSVTALDAPLMNPNLSPITNQGDDSTTVFQTYKSYIKGSAVASYRIRHPVASTFKLGLDGADVTGSVAHSVNESTGEITISESPSIGGSPAGTLTWGGEFYRAFYFTNDDLEEVLRNREIDTFALALQEAKGV